MKQTPEAKAFLKRIISLPIRPSGVSLDSALQPSLDDEAELRRLFVTDKTNVRLKDPFVGLVDIFAAPPAIRTTRARVVKDGVELARKYVMPLSANDRRKEGTPSMVGSIHEFKKNWSAFTEGSLSQLFDWGNVVAAGGAVLACLTPLLGMAKESNRSMKKFYHSTAYPSSDVDLFLWGMNAEQAEKKIITIYEAVRDSIPWDVTYVDKAKHLVFILAQYPYRSVQIVLRLYSSPAEIMAGFDIDAPRCFYNGTQIYANPRAIVAMMRQCNTIDMTRRSPSYEIRLAKYSDRSFEVYIPTLQRQKIDPTIYECSIARIEGPARLLVLKKLKDPDARLAFLDSRRTLRGRPDPLNQRKKRKDAKERQNDNLKAEDPNRGLETSNYDVPALRIPYGPGWGARKIDKLVYQTDLEMNERKLQEEEDKQYIRGRISFIKEDPGHQSFSGSFHPIDTGEWSDQAYIGETQHFFAAIAEHDEQTVSKLIEKGIDVNFRDHVGRTALHVAILSKAREIACILVDAGAKMSACLVDGRSSLHLAAQLDQPSVLQKLLERSAINKKQAEETKVEIIIKLIVAELSKRPPSEDDWSFGEDEVADLSPGDNHSEDVEEIMETIPNPANPGSIHPGTTPTVETENFLENDHHPDVLDVNVPDWDLGFTPLAHAVMSASLSVVEQLLATKADPTLLNSKRDTTFHPLALTILREDEDEVSKILERLISAGATSSAADKKMRTIFHRAVMEGKLKIVSTILRCDPNARRVLDFPSLGRNAVFFPLVSAIERSNYAMVALLLAHGAKFMFTEQDIVTSLSSSNIYYKFLNYCENRISQTFLPVETAIAGYDDIAQLLIAIGADIDIGSKRARENPSVSSYRETNFDSVTLAVSTIDSKIEANQKEIDNISTHTGTAPAREAPKGTWKAYITGEGAKRSHGSRGTENYWPLKSGIAKLEEVRSYLRDMENCLNHRNASDWDDLHPDMLSTAEATEYEERTPTTCDCPSHPSAYYTSHSLCSGSSTSNSIAYDKLFEASFVGDDNQVQRLCLPAMKHKNQNPLHITTQAGYSPFGKTGYTPLYAAISGKKWGTAKLVLAIVAAQCCPPEEEKWFITTSNDIELDEESDSDSDDDNFYDSDESNDTTDQEAPAFIDRQ